jgi:hypothetical protein
VLLDGSNFRVDGLEARAGGGRASHSARVALQCAENQGADLSVNITGRFGVRKCLVGSGLLQTVCIGEFPKTSSGGSISKKTENCVDDAIWVVLGQTCLYGCQNCLVRMLCE